MFGLIALFDIKESSSLFSTKEKERARLELKRLVIESADTEVKNIMKDLVGTGDGFYLLFDTSNYEKIFEHFEKVTLLANKNSSIRIRAVLHIGNFEFDNSFGKSDWIGQGMDEASRYNENRYIREALNKNTTQNIVLGISDKLYDSIKNERWFCCEDWKEYDFSTKSFSGNILLNTKYLEVIPTQTVENNVIEKSKLKEIFNESLHKCDFESKNQEGIVSDINTFFCFPEFSIHSDAKKEPTKIKSERVLEEFIQSPQNIIIYGDEQYGKTTLAKKYYLELFSSESFLPVLIQFKYDEKGFLRNKLSDAISKQYEKFVENVPLVLLLDDFHKLNQVNKKKIMAEINNMHNVYIIMFVIPEFSEHIDNENLVSHYKHYTIRPFGFTKRSELISLWIEFNSTMYSNINFSDLDELEEFAEHTLQNGLIPYTPFYILTILETKRDSIKLDNEITSKGTCYQALVLIALKQMNLETQSEINVIQNFFGFIAFEMFKTKRFDYSEEELEEVFNCFISKYNWDITFEQVIKLLKKNNIFTTNSLNLYSFTGIYFYYFFVARYISNKLTDSYYYGIVKKMVENLQEHDNAYILIFLIHHTRNLILFDEIQLNTMLVYEKDIEIKISKEDTKDLENTIKKLKKTTISAYDKSHENRVVRNEKADEQISSEEDVNQNINSEILDLKKALKTIEVLGQILKNHNGEIDKTQVINCITEGMKALERTCSHILLQFKDCEDEFIDFLNKKIDGQEEINCLSKQEKEELVHNSINTIYLQLMYTTILRCGESLGSKEMVNLFKNIYEKEQSPISFCVYVFCSLWYKKMPPINEIRSEFNKLPLAAQTMLQHLVKDYSDIHHIDYKDKSKLASVLNIKVEMLKIDYSK